MRKSARKVIKRLLKSLSLDEAMGWYNNQHRGRLKQQASSRYDLQRIPIDSDVFLEVYWKNLPIGKGPAVSFFIGTEEIVRIDCFGHQLGHMHTGVFMPTAGEDRLYFPEPTRKAQVNRARFEISRNWSYYQARMADRTVRSKQLDPELVKQAAEKAHAIMCNFLDSIPDLQEAPAAIPPQS